MPAMAPSAALSAKVKSDICDGLMPIKLAASLVDGAGT